MFELHILTMGCFSRNRFWGEKQTVAYREPLCTSALVKGKKFIITDPSLPSEQMKKVLFDRSGLKPDTIDCVFITHAHGDHFVGIECFQDAKWYMAEAELENMKKSGNERDRRLAERIIPVCTGFAEDVEIINLPGHSSGTTGILFDTRDGKTIICGDAVMTRDYFEARAGHINTFDFKQNTESIEKIAKIADIVVPGHDNYFLTGR